MSLDPASSVETGRGCPGASLGGESNQGKGLKSRDELMREIEGLRDHISRLSAASLRISAFEMLWIWPEGVDTA